MLTHRILICAPVLFICIRAVGQGSDTDPNSRTTFGGVTQNWAMVDDFASLVAKSPLIVKGKVIDSHAVKFATKIGDSVYTDSEFEVTTTYKDAERANRQSLTIMQPGGIVDGLHIDNLQSPALKVGEEYILILTRCESVKWCIVQNRGRFHLVAGKAYVGSRSGEGFSVGWREGLKAEGFASDVPENELVKRIIAATQ